MSAWFLKAATKEHLPELMRLAKCFTLENLPPDEVALTKLLELSAASFAGQCLKADARYLFVLEEATKGRVGGSAQIRAVNGSPQAPNYSYLLSHEAAHYQLTLTSNTEGATELGGIIIDPELSGQGLGSLLSLGRLVYIYAWPERFQEEVCAQMAPHMDAGGTNAFWRTYSGQVKDFYAACARARQDKNFVPQNWPSELRVPKSADAAEHLGKVGERSQGAAHMLKKMGFSFRGLVHPFDSGPTLSANIENIALLKNTQSLKLEALLEEVAKLSSRQNFIAAYAWEEPGDFIAFSKSSLKWDSKKTQPLLSFLQTPHHNNPWLLSVF